MLRSQNKRLPFLRKLARAADACVAKTDKMSAKFGEKLPATLAALDRLLQQVYYAACCAWGCRGGDHQIEWLAGRVVNQAMGSYRLLREGLYDESLMLTRGIGEVANLLWLFRDPAELEAWKSASRRERLSQFGPAAVRGRLHHSMSIGAPIDDARYRALCEIGTHPVPALRPGHYTPAAPPVLGHIVQPVGVLVAVTELAYALAMCASALPELLALKAEHAREMKETAIQLVRSLGAFTVLNYEELSNRIVTSHRADILRDEAGTS